MRILPILVATGLAFSLGAGSAHAGPARLNAAAIKQLFPGYFEARVKGYKVTLTGHKNGALKGEAYGRKDEGRWSVKGNALCVSFNDWTKGEAMCGTIVKDGEWFVAAINDGSKMKFRPLMVAQQN
jgi:hypothetical protein